MQTQTLKSRIDALLGEMVKATPPETMGVIMAEIDKLANSGVTSRALAVGTSAPRFTLADTAGKKVSLDELLARGPVVVRFNRGTWCPFCDLELKATSEALKAQKGLSATLVVLMPQAPAKIAAAVEGRDYGFSVLHDDKCGVARQFGVAFTLPEPLRPVYTAFNMNVSEWNSDGSWDLPFPSTFVIGRDGRVAWSAVEANWTVRPEPADVVAAVANAVRAAA